MILNKDKAYWQLHRLVREQNRCAYGFQPTNKQRHLILRPINNKDQPSYYCMYKREWFMSFNIWFPKYILQNTQFAGISQTINEECLKTALTTDYILIIMPNETIYQISPQLWKKYADEHHLKRSQNTTNTYKQQGGTTTQIQETTYCIPAKLLTKWETKQQ